MVHGKLRPTLTLTLPKLYPNPVGNLLGGRQSSGGQFMGAILRWEIFCYGDSGALQKKINYDLFGK